MAGTILLTSQYLSQSLGGPYVYKYTKLKLSLCCDKESWPSLLAGSVLTNSSACWNLFVTPKSIFTVLLWSFSGVGRAAKAMWVTWQFPRWDWTRLCSTFSFQPQTVKFILSALYFVLFIDGFIVWNCSQTQRRSALWCFPKCKVWGASQREHVCETSFRHEF